MPLTERRNVAFFLCQGLQLGIGMLLRLMQMPSFKTRTSTKVCSFVVAYSTPLLAGTAPRKAISFLNIYE